MNPTRWHVTKFMYGDKGLDEGCRRERIWTVSRDPDRPGWETDCACDGYGLTYREAKELADAANAVYLEAIACPATTQETI